MFDYYLPSGFDDFFDDVNSAFNLLYKDAASSYGEAFPPTNQAILKTDKSLEMQFALAGYSKDELSVSVENDYITISGKPLENATAKDDKQYCHNRIKKVAFTRKYRLPSSKYDTSKATAKYENGLLTITVPLAAAAQSTQLAIE